MNELVGALRSLGRSPGFAAATILTLALGVGANTGAFSAIYTLLLKPLPYPHPEQLVALHETTVDRKPRGVAEANLLDWRARSSSFQAMAAYRPRSFGLTLRDDQPITVIQTGMVMADFFRVVHVAPAMGRSFTGQEEVTESHLMVLTDRLWHQLFAGDRSAIGRTVWLNEEPHTVIGIMPPGFEYPMDRVVPDAYIPLSRKDYCCGRLGSLDAVARLNPAISLGQARADMESVATAVAREYPATNAGRSAALESLQTAWTGDRRAPLFLLLAACLALLAIACANVAGMVLARRLSRSHEMAIRAALGAGASRLARQCLAEAAVLSSAGALFGFLAAKLVLAIIPQFISGAARNGPLRLDSAAFTIGLALALPVTLLLGIIPASRLRSVSVYPLIQAGGRQSPRGGRGWVRSGLVVTQIALSVVLLLSTGLLLRSFLKLLATSPGFETAHAWRFGIGLPEKRYDTDLKLIGFHHQLLSKLAELPGVQTAGAASRLPLRGGAAGPSGSFQILGANIPMPQRPRSWVNTASPGYFEAMGIPLVEGRAFSWRDDLPGQHRVAVVNQAFARAYLRDRRAVGTLLDIRWVSELNPLGVAWEIIGVTGDTRQANLDREPIPEIFLSMSQVGSDGGAYVVRSRGGEGMAQAIAKTVEAQDPRIERVHPGPLRSVVEDSLESRAVAMRLISAFAGLALLLASVGVYGIVAFRAAERTREMAIRSALGGTAAHLRRLIFAHAFRIGMAGLAAGLAAFRLTAPLLKSQLYGVEPFDPPTLAIVAIMVLGVVLATSLAPSRRAGRTAPMELLRDA